MLAEIKKWNVTTFVIQRVGPAGNWYDHSIWNKNPMEIIHPDFKALFDDAMPKDEPWRLIRRVAEETIIDEHEP